MTRLGLRGKSVLALLGACGVAVLFAAWIGWQALKGIREHFGADSVRNYTLLQKQRILAPVSRELALAQRLADSEVVREWIHDEANPQKRSLFFREAAGYQRSFADHSWFVISDLSHHYYFNDGKSAPSDQPRYTLDPSKPADAWYFSTMTHTERFNLNVDYDVNLHLTKIWFNVIMRDGAGKIGLAGTGLDLTTFLRDAVGQADAGFTPMIVDAQGAIVAHPDARLISMNNAGSRQVPEDKKIDRLFDRAGADALHAAMQAAVSNPGGAQVFDARFDGKPQLMALVAIPELNWYALTALNPSLATVIAPRLLWPLLLAGVALLATLLLVGGYVVNRLILRPLLRLTDSARRIAAGDYSGQLPVDGQDEIGELTHAFSVMAQQVRDHTTQLESRVQERTHALMQANQSMEAARKKIGDSIEYASLIQRAMLPDRQLLRSLGENHFVLWRPRDVVGGDFYIYRATDEGQLIGVVDCAGHGVPGAFMTMLAHAALDLAINEVGLSDPAAILSRADGKLRAMLQQAQQDNRLATNMDVGLAYVDTRARQVTFAGAKISLYHCDGNEVGELKGDRRALGDKRVGRYHNHTMPFRPGSTFYLSTDGFLDQAGGERGFGFGNTRFADMLRQHASMPLSQQVEAFTATLGDYQRTHAQRDDITLLAFRFE